MGVHPPQGSNPHSFVLTFRYKSSRKRKLSEESWRRWRSWWWQRWLVRWRHCWYCSGCLSCCFRLLRYIKEPVYWRMTENKENNIRTGQSTRWNLREQMAQNKEKVHRFLQISNAVRRDWLHCEANSRSFNETGPSLISFGDQCCTNSAHLRMK